MSVMVERTVVLPLHVEERLLAAAGAARGPALDALAVLHGWKSDDVALGMAIAAIVDPGWAIPPRAERRGR